MQKSGQLKQIWLSVSGMLIQDLLFRKIVSFRDQIGMVSIIPCQKICFHMLPHASIAMIGTENPIPQYTVQKQ
jgi:hypothetical protein